MFRRIIICGLILTIFCMALYAQEQGIISSPKYFGPNAFPFPTISNGTVEKSTKLEARFAAYSHTEHTFGQDLTEDFSAKLTLPLFSDRVNLVIWGQLVEAYQGTETKNVRTGDIYISTDIQLLTQKKHHVNLTLRYALKTAPGGDYRKLRFYDSAGYFFDATIGHRFDLSDDFALNLSANSGFLCWQTDVNRQNDAYLYGIRADCMTKIVDLRVQYGGYLGWQDNGDRPMIIRGEICRQFKRLGLILCYEQGLHDFPYRGLKFSFVYYL